MWYASQVSRFRSSRSTYFMFSAFCTDLAKLNYKKSSRPRRP